MIAESIRLARSWLVGFPRPQARTLACAGVDVAIEVLFRPAAEGDHLVGIGGSDVVAARSRELPRLVVVGIWHSGLEGGKTQVSLKHYDSSRYCDLFGETITPNINGGAVQLELEEELGPIFIERELPLLDRATTRDSLVEGPPRDSGPDRDQSWPADAGVPAGVVDSGCGCALAGHEDYVALISLMLMIWALLTGACIRRHQRTMKPHAARALTPDRLFEHEHEPRCAEHEHGYSCFRSAPQ